MATSNTTTHVEDNDATSPTEQTPLLPPSSDAEAHTSHPPDGSARTSLLTSLQNPTSNSKGKKRRWPSILALAILCIVVICIIVFAFLAPSITESYAQQAAVFTPLELSIDSFTAQGVKARVKGQFSMDASRVEKKSIRDLGRFFTFIANQAETGESEVEVSLPEYGNLVLGTARVPGVWVSVRNGHTTLVDVAADLRPGDVGGIRRVAEDFIQGRLGQVRVLGKADVPVKSGVISLGKQRLVQEMVFAGEDIPKLPAYHIGKLDVHDIDLPGGGTGMMANVSISANNSYPIDFTLPSLGFDILVPGCAETDSLIKLADAETQETHILPHDEVVLNVTGLVHELSPNLTRNCPVDNSDDKALSPLDRMVARYLHGSNNTVYIQGSSPQPNPNTPSWLTDIISDIMVPIPLPGKAVQGHLIRNFSLTDTHFALPDPFAEPGTKAGNPRISANVKALVALPEEMNFELNVSRVRADAEIFYHGKKLGTLDLRKWQVATSSRVPADGDGKKGEKEKEKEGGQLLLIESTVKDAPVDITDDDVFTDVLQDLLFGGKDVRMQIRALVDVEVGSSIGGFVVKGLEGEGAVVVKPISSPPGSGGNGGVGVPHEFRPKVFGLQILDTSPTSLTLGARVNISNPTNYSASVPFMDIHILANETVIGHATAKGIEIVPGKNDNLYVEAVWDPSTLGGEEGKKVGREFLSQYISGYNTSLTLKAHEGSIPGNPGLGRALGRFGVEMPTPSLGSAPRKRVPGEPDDGDGDGKKKKGPHFLDDATFHLLTSTATFTLLSPLRQTILYVESINATAFYKGDSVGHIDYDLPFAVPPVGPDGEGVVSPRLPVDWSLGSVGYEAVKGALGGRLKLAAYAEVGVRIGEWREGVWFRGGGIGASVRL
ncbi:hypothetical protein LTR17_006805 [Elasticomyces elasticus]|nr:hypothetical protein LTR17_006805 [Elasticomyces elasticus]